MLKQLLSLLFSLKVDRIHRDQIRTLHLLRFQGQLTAPAIARSIGVALGNTYPLLAELESRGLIEKQAFDQVEGLRRFQYRISEAGSQALEGDRQ